jgi:hypothetical protein
MVKSADSNKEREIVTYRRSPNQKFADIVKENLVSPNVRSQNQSTAAKSFHDARSYYTQIMDKSQTKEPPKSTLVLVTKKPKEVPTKPVPSNVQVRNRIEQIETEMAKF